MTPEERELLNRSVKLAEENNKLLLTLRGHLRWQNFWSLIKILLVVIPLVFGYLFLEPYLKPLMDNFKGVQELLNTPR